MIQLRQAFEVCGMLSDVYIARKRNYRGQIYGFLRFLNVRNRDKLSNALNNVWIGHSRIWARGARFDRFAADTVESFGVERRKEEVGRVVVSVRREGVKNIRVGKKTGEGDNFEVREDVEGLKVLKKEEVVAAVVECEGGGGSAVVRKEEQLMVDVVNKVDVKGAVKVQPRVLSSELQGKEFVRSIPKYTSLLADRTWATSGMVASVVGEDSTVALQQKVNDAGFINVMVIPMGGDRVFLYCTGGEDIWHVFNEALHFFGMLFNNIHMWSPEDVKFELGAWVRVYGVPIHAWNEVFFKMCVTDVGRYVRADDCTVDKARIDFARVLLSTPLLEIVNTSFDFIIDGSLFGIKVVEEWGCNLGEDAFLTEVEIETKPEPFPNCVEGLDEVQGEWELGAR